MFAELFGKIFLRGRDGCTATHERRLRFEVLEERQVLAQTFFVSSPIDADAGSLPTAIDL